VAHKYGLEVLAWVFSPEDEAEARLSGFQAGTIRQVDSKLQEAVREPILAFPEDDAGGDVLSIDDTSEITDNVLHNSSEHSSVEEDLFDNLFEGIDGSGETAPSPNRVAKSASDSP